MLSYTYKMYTNKETNFKIMQHYDTNSHLAFLDAITSVINIPQDQQKRFFKQIL